jgi:hypothetical protein
MGCKITIMKRFFLVMLIGVILGSCSKDQLTDNDNIKEWTSNLDADAQIRYQLRLAFGKTLAAALKEPELRRYFKEKSLIEGDSIYNELVFKLIKNDILPSGKSVKQLIAQYEDSEVKDIFGTSLLDIM